MGYPGSSMIGLITTVVFIGGFVGSFLAPLAADQYGRRAAILIGSVLGVIGAAIQTAAQNSGMFIAGRLIIGFGISFTTCGGPSLINELAHPRMRGTIASMVRAPAFVLSSGLFANCLQVQCALVCGIHHRCLDIFWNRPYDKILLVVAHPVSRSRNSVHSCPLRPAFHSRVSQVVVFPGKGRPGPPSSRHLPCEWLFFR